MIIDLKRFIESERKNWEELESILDLLARDPVRRMPLDEIKRFHYLYERVSADLARLSTFAAEKDTRRYLETLVARAYGEIHETREKPHRMRPFHWTFHLFPQTFRRHLHAFQLSVAITLAGCAFGSLMIAFDPAAKEVLMPFQQLQQNPADRVANEEKILSDRLNGTKAQGAAWYIRNNTNVAITTMALGVTWGIGTIFLLFTNGVMLGAVAMDYIQSGQSIFLLGWLLPHGAFEIPAILLAGQAGLVLAGALIGWGRRAPMRQRLRGISSDLVTLIGGVALMLVWAGIIEAFLSQYHAPVLPYWLKITFGTCELILLVLFFSLCGRHPTSASTLNDGAPS